MKIIQATHKYAFEGKYEYWNILHCYDCAQRRWKKNSSPRTLHATKIDSYELFANESF